MNVKLISLAVNPLKSHRMYTTLEVIIGIYFTYVSLISNKQIKKIISTVEPTFPIWLFGLAFILVLFSFIYYHFISIYLFEEKIKDYGVINSLGLSSKQIKQLFQRSLGKSAYSTFFKGLLAGFLLYYIILFFLNKVFSTLFYDIPLFSIIIVIASFFIIFTINLMVLGNRILKLPISEMLAYKRKDKSLKHPLSCQIGGFASLLLGLILLIWNKSGGTYGPLSALLPMIFLSVCTFLLTLSFPYWFIRLFAYSKERQHANLFYISQLRTNYKKFSKLLAACTLIILFGLYLLILDLALMTSADNMEAEHPFDYVVDIPILTNKTISHMNDFESYYALSIQTSHLIEINNGTIQWDNETFDYPIRVMPERSYTQLSNDILALKDEEIIVLTQVDRQYYNVMTSFSETGVEWSFRPLGLSSFKVGNTIYEGDVIGEKWEILYNVEEQDLRTFIVSNSLYDTMTLNGLQVGGKYLLNEIDSKNSDNIYTYLHKISNNIESRTINLERQKQGKLFMLMLILVAVLLLFISLISLMALRIQQNIKDEKKKYENLYTLGYTKKQLTQELKKEMLTLFFLPVAIGTPLSVLYVIFSNESANIQLVIISILVSGLFILVEYFVYFFTTKALSYHYLVSA